MNQLHDILLPLPLSALLLEVLLFFAFFVHLLFVLLTLGTAVLGVVAFIRARATEDDTWQEHSQRLLKFFFVHKSLAIVFGVGPLLLVQVGLSVPFLSAASLLAPLWMAIVLLLITALLALEALKEHGRYQARRFVFLGGLGLCCLLIVPGIFAAVVTVAENPQSWPEVAARLGELPASLAVHWALRVFHVLGAAVLFSALFHYFRVPPSAADLRRMLRSWIAGSSLYQFVLGVALYASVPGGSGTMADIAVATGALGAASLLWIHMRSRTLLFWRTGVLALTTFTAMLVARQLLQDRQLVPLMQLLRERAAAAVEGLAASRQQAVVSYRAQLDVPYAGGLTIYMRSCSFCHGVTANGQGPEANSLWVPPEDLAAMRIQREELHQILRRGVDGTAMPRFGMYTEDELNEVIDVLVGAGLKHQPGAVPVRTSSADARRASEVYRQRCALCHGAAGHGSAIGRQLSPSPPDLARISLAPARAFEVITHGYPGTAMPAFEGLPEPVRWELVRKVLGMYGRL